MHLIHARGVEKSYGDRVVLRDVNFRIASGERVGLVGINGAGKSTLLRILTDIDSHDGGSIHRTCTIGILEQNPSLDGKTVQDAVEEATEWHRALLREYEKAVNLGNEAMSVQMQDRLDLVGWDLGHNISAMLHRVKAPPKTTALASLSGGERRRVALAKTLLSGADLLVLDEPTNHLDAETIDWLEAHLRGLRGGVLLVTHDRYLLEAVANRIVEIEDGQTVSYEGSYGDYLIARAERQSSLARAEERRMKLIAREAAWAARSPAARSTKQKARLQRLANLVDQRRLKVEGDLRFGFGTKDRFGRVLLDANDLSFSFGRRLLIKGLRFSLLPQTRLGVIGANGTGKSTLLKLISGDLELQDGVLNRASRLKIGTMDQNRSGLIPNDTVFEAVGGGADYVRIGDQHIHVATFLDRFLFSREMREQKVSALSGGEQARLLMAKLILSGANLLLLDEPTNDLDLITLRSLEEALIGFEGAAVIVTHDRAFLDRVCTSVLSFEGDGRVMEYADRLQAMAALAERRQGRQKERTIVADRPVRNKKESKKLSYKEKRELEELPELIEGLETEYEKLSELFNDPETYKDASLDIKEMNRRLKTLEERISETYGRWEELSEKEG